MIDDCPSEQDLVCGSDKKTYGNKCLMKATACKENKAIEVVAKRKCGEFFFGCCIHYIIIVIVCVLQFDR